MNLKGAIAKIFRKVVPLPFNNPADYYHIGGGWGTAITFQQDDAPAGMSSMQKKVSGFQPRRPSVGDVLQADMRSGRKGTYIFTQVKLCNDPNDMFFGTVEWRGYADELDMPEKKKYEGLGYIL